MLSWLWKKRQRIEFLDLPCEIRELVYGKVWQGVGLRTPFGDAPETSPIISLLLVSRTVYSEAKPIFYRECTVCVDSIAYQTIIRFGCADWPGKKLDLAPVQHIVTCYWGMWAKPVNLAALSPPWTQLTGLKSVRVQECIVVDFPGSFKDQLRKQYIKDEYGKQRHVLIPCHPDAIPSELVLEVLKQNLKRIRDRKRRVQQAEGLEVSLAMSMEFEGALVNDILITKNGVEVLGDWCGIANMVVDFVKEC